MKVQAQAPSRISLFGGGTDLDSFSSKYGGVCISMAINLRTSLTLYTGSDMWELPGNRIPWNADPALFYKIRDNFNIGGMHLSRVRSRFDGIIGAGLGSSASAGVALTGAIYKARGLVWDRYSIAKDAYTAEVTDLGWNGGRQDGIAASFGGLNRIDFNEGSVSVKRMSRVDADSLCGYLCLFYIGGIRSSSQIQKHFGYASRGQIEALKEIKDLAEAAEELINSGQFVYLGGVMDHAWELKKKSNPSTTTEKIDNIYEYARLQGALGGKVIGAGGSGYMLFMVMPDDRPRLIEKMVGRGFTAIDFMPDFNGVEARIV